MPKAKPITHVFTEQVQNLDTGEELIVRGHLDTSDGAFAVISIERIVAAPEDERGDHEDEAMSS